MNPVDQLGIGLFCGGLITVFALVAFDIYTDWRNSR